MPPAYRIMPMDDRTPDPAAGQSLNAFGLRPRRARG